MKPHRPVYLAAHALTPFTGKGHPRFISPSKAQITGQKNPSLEEQIAQVIRQLFAGGGPQQQSLDANLVDRGLVGNFAGELFSQQGHVGAMVSRGDSRLEGVGFTRCEAACASGGVSLVGGAEAIQAGCDVVLVLGAEAQNTVKARVGADYLARASHYETERSLDEFTFPAMFARRLKAYKERYQVSTRDVAQFSVKAFGNANRNPLAHMHHVQMSLEQAESTGEHNPTFLQSPELNPHLRISDCSPVTDGAAAAIFASKEGLDKLGIAPNDCIQLMSYALASNPLGKVGDLLHMDTTALACHEVFADAGKGPADIQVAEVHDCFTIAELLMYEAIGWAKAGQGLDRLQSGDTTLEGKMPVNTGGGLVGFGHPVGATGVKQAVEIHRQMKGLCGDYQIKNAPQLGLTVNMGGDDRTCVAMVWCDAA